jgi:hypothetical protein
MLQSCGGKGRPEGHFSVPNAFVDFFRLIQLSIIYRYGVEGIVYTEHTEQLFPPFEFDADRAMLICQKIEISLFHRVVVQISVDTNNIARQRLVLKLVEPSIPGYSVISSSPKRRKLNPPS